MATHYTCDGCDVALDRHYTHDRFRPQLQIGGRIVVTEVMISTVGDDGLRVSNRGDYCLSCVKRVLTEGREERALLTRPKVEADGAVTYQIDIAPAPMLTPVAPPAPRMPRDPRARAARVGKVLDGN